MGRIGKEVAGQIICFSGFIGLCLVCGLPMWRSTTYIGANIVTGQIVWDGLWMKCVMQATGQMQCSMQESILQLSQDLQTARALSVISLVVGFIGFILTFIGAKCTSCLTREASQAKMVILGGAICILSGVLCLIPVCWSATVTVADYMSAFTIETQKRELGASIYIGWGASLLLIIGGCILCTSCPPQDNRYRYPNYPPPYPYPGSIVNGGTYMPAKTYMPQYAPAGQYVPSQPYAAGRPYSPGQYL